MLLKVKCITGEQKAQFNHGMLRKKSDGQPVHKHEEAMGKKIENFSRGAPSGGDKPPGNEADSAHHDTFSIYHFTMFHNTFTSLSLHLDLLRPPSHFELWTVNANESINVRRKKVKLSKCN